MPDVSAPPVDLAALFDALPTAYLVMDPDLVIVEANRTYTALLGRDRRTLVGRYVFDAFPPSPDTLERHGLNPLESSFRRALMGHTDVMPVFQYDVLDPATGTVVPRHWSLIHAPLTDAQGRVRFLLQRVEDVTSYVLERTRVEDVEAQMYVRAREVEIARDAERAAARTVAAQAEIALRLIRAADHDEVIGFLTDFGRTVLAATCLATALAGERPAGAATADVIAAGCSAVVHAPVVSEGEHLGEIAFGWDQPRELSPTDHDIVEAVAAQYGQAVRRLRLSEAELRAAEAAMAMSETLQRSLLSEPARVRGLELTARYRAASQQARVGGDWYDGFCTADGTTTLAVGDVSGHDGEAAALMGQVRSLLRGIAYATSADPGHLLDILDDALFDLGVDALASAVVLTVHDAPDGRRIRWSNAGHPPPLLLGTDGSVQVLAGTPELLLGCQTGTGRSVHEVDLPDGAAVLLYTDGLVERRADTIDDGIEWLRRTVQDLAGCPPQELVERLVDSVGDAEDDVMLLLAQARPSHVLDERLAAAPRSVTRARTLVVDSCVNAGIAEQVAEAAALVVSEAVTNAVVHGQGEVRLVLDVRDHVVRLEVSDDEPAGPVRRAVDLDALGGRGMQLIDALALDWGGRSEPPGKTVWAELG